MQQSVPGSKKTQLYTLNRIYSPIFEITYRTRGGINEEYDSAHFSRLINEESVSPRRELVVEGKFDNQVELGLD